jgi:hypothetical protein
VLPKSASLLWTLALISALAGCQSEQEALQLPDLTPAEHEYITRFVTLERARAVALADLKRGTTLLDSLAAAWGDSSREEITRGLSREPLRMAAVNDLLARILKAERDSLLHAPEPRRLTSPLPDPPPPAKSD